MQYIWSQQEPISVLITYAIIILHGGYFLQAAEFNKKTA